MRVRFLLLLPVQLKAGMKARFPESEGSVLRIPISTAYEDTYFILVTVRTRRYPRLTIRS